MRFSWIVTALLIVACTRSEPSSSARVDAWRDDLHVLATELPDKHVHAFFHADEAAWRRSVAELDGQLVRLDDAHIVVGFARLVAAIGDGHTQLGHVLGRGGTYPLALIWFDDGIFVAGADADHASAIGAKLVAIGAQPIDHVIDIVSPLVARDNLAGLHGQLPALLVDAAILAGTDLATADRATFRVAATDGTTRELELHPSEHGAAIAPPRPLPLHLQGPNTLYWNKYVETDHLLYFAYNACADDPRVGPFATFAAQTLAFVDQHRIDRFVIDLRRNQGGNSQIIEPLLVGLAARPALAGRVFAIIGMETFSSAVIAAMELKRRVHATLVGGPTAGNPSGYGEVKSFSLPHSKLFVQYSTKLFSNPDFSGDAVRPDVPVVVDAADWFGGRDPALDAIEATPIR